MCAKSYSDAAARTDPTIAGGSRSDAGGICGRRADFLQILSSHRGGPENRPAAFDARTAGSGTRAGGVGTAAAGGAAGGGGRGAGPRGRKGAASPPAAKKAAGRLSDAAGLGETGRRHSRRPPNSNLDSR